MSVTIGDELKALLSSSVERGQPLTAAEVAAAGVPQRRAREIAAVSHRLTAEKVDRTAAMWAKTLEEDLTRPFGDAGREEARRRFGTPQERDRR